VKRDLQRPSRLNEFAGAIDIDGIVFEKYADSNAIEAELTGGRDGAEHGGELGVGVAEIPGAGANDCEDRDFEFVVDLAESGHRRCDATMRQLRAEFYAVGAATFSGKSGVEGFYGDFQKTFERHGSLADEKRFIYS